MGTNGCTGQLVGPFLEQEELFTKIQEDAIDTVDYVNHLGIQTRAGNHVCINNKEYEIGKTGIYEIGNTKVNSIYFLQDVDGNTIIDYTIILK